MPQPIVHSDGKLRIFAEGNCARLRASLLDNAVFVHTAGTIGRWNGSAIVDVDMLSKGADGIAASWIEGEFPRNAWLLYRDRARADHALRWERDHWELVWGQPKTEQLTSFTRTPNGAFGTTYERRIHQEGNRIITSHPHEVGIPAPLEIGPHEKSLYGIEVRSNGEIFALLIGDEDEHKTLEIRRSPKMVPEPLPITGFGKIFLTSKSAWVSSEEGLATFDGNKWIAVSGLPTYASAVEEDRDGAIWFLAGGKLYRRGADGTFVDASPPKTVDRFAGASKGAPHVISAWGEVYRWKSGAWSSVELPHPTTIPDASPLARYIVVANEEELWVEAEFGDPRDMLGGKSPILFKTGPMPSKIYDCTLR